MTTFISAENAVARTNNARNADAYKGEHEVYPEMMKQIMDNIADVTARGKGSVFYDISHNYFYYTDKAIEIGRALMEDKMRALGYRIIQENENLYRFVWLTD